jgi:hypothetical protein
MVDARTNIRNLNAVEGYAPDTPLVKRLSKEPSSRAYLENMKVKQKTATAALSNTLRTLQAL